MEEVPGMAWIQQEIDVVVDMAVVAEEQAQAYNAVA